MSDNLRQLHLVGAAHQSASGGGGATPDQKLRPVNGTEIGTSGKVTAGASDDEIVMRIDDDQAAGVGGIDGMIGGIFWDLGSTIKGPVCVDFEWVQKVNLTNVVIVVMRRDSAPTSLADIDSASTRWLQIRTSNAGGVSTFLGLGTGNLGNVNNENKATSVSIAFQVAIDEKGLGPSMCRHYFTAQGTQGRTNGTTTNQATGKIYIAALFSKSGSAAQDGDADIKIKLAGGMPMV